MFSQGEPGKSGNSGEVGFPGSQVSLLTCSSITFATVLFLCKPDPMMSVVAAALAQIAYTKFMTCFRDPEGFQVHQDLLD